MSVSDGLYTSNWKMMNLKDKKTILFLMQESQPKYFKASEYFTFSVPNYTKVKKFKFIESN